MVRTRRSKPLNSRNSTACTANSASAIASKLACPTTSSFTRSANRFGVVFPTFSAAQAGLDIAKLLLQQLARGEHRSRLLRPHRLAMPRSEPPKPHQLRDPARIFAVRLHRHHLEGVV